MDFETPIVTQQKLRENFQRTPMEPKLSFITNEILEKIFVKSLGCVCWKKFHFSFSPPTGREEPITLAGHRQLEARKDGLVEACEWSIELRGVRERRLLDESFLLWQVFVFLSECDAGVVALLSLLENDLL